MTTATIVLTVVTVCLASYGVIAREVTRRTIEARRAITNTEGIETDEIVEIGGVSQYINIRGHDRDNPVLLFLHGGPGTPMSPIAHAFQDAWEDRFTVVQWDQRGAGKTYRLTPPREITETMSMERMIDDVVELTHYLRRSFMRERIFLLGHSWGSMIGLVAAKTHPELYYAYIGAGQTIHPMRSETLGYERTLMLARKVGHERAVSALETLAPYPTVAGVYETSSIRHRWNAYFGESIFGYRSLTAALRDFVLDSPDYTLGDLVVLFRGDTSVYEPLRDIIVGYDAYRYGLEWRIPVLMIHGRHDWQVNYLLAQEYVEAIHAPYKAFFLIDDAAHAPMVTQAAQFAEILIDYARPLADRRTHE